MPVQHVRPQFLDDPVGAPGRGEIARTDMALHWRAMDAERQHVLHLLEQTLLEFAAGGRIADDADRMTGSDLRFGQVAHMPENSSDG